MKNNVFCTDYGCRTIEQNYECNLIKYNVKFYTKPILSCFLILQLFLDEILMLRILHQLCKQLNTNYANGFILVCSTSYAGCFCLVCWFSCSFVSEACACLGDGCERLCASRPLLGSYVHQESI